MDLWLIAEGRDHSGKRARVVWRFEVFLGTLFSVAYLNLLSESDIFKILFEQLNLKDQCVSALITEAEKLSEEIAEHGKKEAATTGTFAEGREMKQAAAGRNRVIALKLELQKAKAWHELLFETDAHSEACALEAQVKLQNS